MPLRIAIAAWNAGPVIDPAAGGVIGGLETSAWLLARALAAQDRFQVTLVLRHTCSLPAHSHGVTIEPVIEPLRPVRLSVASAVERRGSFPWLKVRRFEPGLLWKIPLLAAARILRGRVAPEIRLRQHIRAVAPELWLALGASRESAAVIEIADQMGLKSLFWVRSNGDLDLRFFAEPGYQNSYGVRSADAQTVLKRAAAIICQTAWQQARVQELVGREARVIRNPVEVERWAANPRDFASRNAVLWIGRYDRFHKRPELGLEIARNLPDIPFLFVINRGDAMVERAVRRKLPANVQLIDFVPRDEMPGLFAQARVLLFTGAGQHEGFPNVLLEAAAAGVPSVSLEDFDGLLVRSGGKSCEGDLTEAARQIQHLWSDRAVWEARAWIGRSYVLREHSVARAVEEFERVVANLGEAKSR